MRLRRLLPLCSALLVLTGWSSPAQDLAAPLSQPAPGRPTLHVQAGVGLYPGEGDGVRPGWAPVWLGLENRGASLRLELEVVLRSGGEQVNHGRAVELPAGQSRREWFVVPIQADATWEVLVREEGAEEPLLRSGVRTVPFDPGWSAWGYRPALRVLELVEPRGDPTLSEPWLPALALRSPVRRAPPALVPDQAHAWQDVDVVALRGTDLGALSRPQLEALRQWVLTGGQLLLAPTERPGWLEDRALVHLTGPLPVEVVEAAPDCLADLYPAAPGRASHAAFTRTPARLLRTSAPLRRHSFQADPSRTGRGRAWPPVQRLGDGRALPLVQAVPRGQGTVHLLAFDPGGGAFRDWFARGEFLDDLCAWLEFVARDRPPPLELEDQRMVDSRRRPALWPALVLVAVYVACVGPLNGWLLRRRQAQPLLVLTVPALSLLFSALVFGLGAVIRGTSVTFWRVRVLAGQLGDPVLRERTLASVLAGGAGAAGLRIAPGQAALRLPPLRGGAWHEPWSRRDAPGQAAHADVPLEPWMPTCLLSEGLCETGRGVSISRAQGGVTLRNDLPFALVAPTWTAVDRIYSGPPRVEPGQTVTLAPRSEQTREEWLQVLASALAGAEPRRVELARRTITTHTSWQRAQGLLAGVDRPAALELEGDPPELELDLLHLGGGP